VPVRIHHRELGVDVRWREGIEGRDGGSGVCGGGTMYSPERVRRRWINV